MAPFYAVTLRPRKETRFEDTLRFRLRVPKGPLRDDETAGGNRWFAAPLHQARKGRETRALPFLADQPIGPGDSGSYVIFRGLVQRAFQGLRDDCEHTPEAP